MQVAYQNRLASAKIREYLKEQLPQQDGKAPERSVVVLGFGVFRGLGFRSRALELRV